MKIVIDNTALFSKKNGVYRYTECVINGLIDKLGKNNIKLFPVSKLIEFAKNKDIKLLAELDGKPLYMHLQKLKTDVSQEEINKVIDSFIVSK